jgi:DegV family protein with EDD domain
MRSTCIVTDATAQFSQPNFRGHEFVQIIPFSILEPGAEKVSFSQLSLGEFPSTVYNAFSQILVIPDQDLLRQFFVNLTSNFQEFIVITCSSHLSLFFKLIQEAVSTLSGKITFHFIDSQTTSFGLGFLVQIAAEAAEKGLPFNEIDWLVRKYIPHLYAIIFIQDPSYLAQAGFMDKAQAITCEWLSLFPVYNLEDGCLSPVEKVRSQRQGMELFQEFLGEFDNLNHIGFLQAYQPSGQDNHSLRDLSQSIFPKSHYSEMQITPALAALFGPHAMGLFAIERLE